VRGIITLLSTEHLLPKVANPPNVLLIAIRSLEATPDLAGRTNQRIAPMNSVLNTVEEPEDNQGISRLPFSIVSRLEIRRWINKVMLLPLRDDKGLKGRSPLMIIGLIELDAHDTKLARKVHVER
jgi:hypothetical protein